MNSLDFCWAYVLLEELRRFGVNDICIASGARCLPLVYAVSQMNFSSYTHLDERSLAFFALGLAKVSLKPVLIITTSGTAVANVLPAIVEAYYARVPLFVVSADRPWELHECEVNQSIDQESIFTPFVAQSLSLPVPDSRIELTYLLQRIDNALFKHQTNDRPLHFNMQFRKPFFKPFKDIKQYIAPVKFWFDDSRMYRQMNEQSTFVSQSIHPTVKDILSSKEPIIIICGEIASKKEADIILKFAESSGACLLVDPLSKLLFKKHDHILLTPEFWIKSAHLPSTATIFWMGERLVSQIIINWVKNQTCQFVRINPKASFSDASVKSGLFLQQDYQSFVQTYQSNMVQRQYKDCCLYEAEQLYFKKTLKPITYLPCAYQAYFMNILSSFPENHLCMVSNSLPIRILNQIKYQSNNPPVFIANRGASGIDGVLSSAIGIAQSSNQMVSLLIGDMAFMHDVGALYLLKQLKVKVQIICFNNGGGGIFSVLDLVKDRLFCDQYLKLSHSFSFKDLAKHVGISYYAVHSSMQIKKYLNQSIDKSVLIECYVDDDQTKQVYQSI